MVKYVTKRFKIIVKAMKKMSAQVDLRIQISITKFQEMI